MPKLQQYISQAQPQGTVRGVMPESPRVGGMVVGLNNAANNIQRGADIRDAQMAHERERIATEEAQAYVSKASGDVRQQMTEFLINAENSGEPAAGTTDRALKQLDALGKAAIDSAPELAKGALTQRLEQLRTGVHEKAFGFEANARRAAVITSFHDSSEQAKKTAMADPTQFGPLYAEQVAAANNLTLSQQDKAKVIEDTRSGLAYAASIGIINRDPDVFLNMAGMAGGKTGKDGKPLPSDPEKAAKAVASNPILANLDAKDLQQLTERATMLSVTRQNQIAAEQERARARSEAAANKAEREAGQAYTILRDMQMDGRRIDPNNPENKLLMQKVQAVPAYAKAFTAMSEAVPANAAAAVQPIPVQREQLNTLYAQRNKDGTSPALEAEIKRREKVLGSAESDYKAEPLKAGADRGVIPAIAPLDTSTLDGFEKGLSARAVQADQVARIPGAPVSPMTNAEASVWADRINALPPDERGKRIATMTATVGPEQAQALATQIDAKDRALSLEIAVGSTMTTQGRTVGELIRRGAQVAKDKGIKEDKSAEFGLRATLAKEVGPMLNGQAREDVIDAARYIIIAKESAGEKMDYAGAVELALGGKIVEHNGKRLPAPPQFTEERFKASLASMTPADIPARVIFTPTGATLTPAEFLARLQSAELEPAGTGRYYVRAPGGYLMGENRRPLPIEVR